MEVEIVFWEPKVDMAIASIKGAMRALPSQGDPYWHGITAYRVKQVDDSGPPVVQLERDPEREAFFYGQLPTGYTIDGGRDSSTGKWHALVFGKDARVVRGWGYGDECDAVVGDAVAMAKGRES